MFQATTPRAAFEDTDHATLITAGLRVRDSVELADPVRDLQAEVARYRGDTP